MATKSATSAAAPPATPESAPAKKSGGKKFLLFGVIGLVILAGGGAGAYFAFFNHSTSPDAEKKAAAPSVPVFLPLEPFTVNLQNEDGDPQYLQVGLVIQLATARAADALKERMPEIRNRILLLLSSRKPSQLDTSVKKQQLATDLLAEVKRTLPPESGGDAVGVLYTSFIIQ